MIAISLQSGSNGNCIYVEANGVRLLFDAGICGIRAERRMDVHGRDIRAVDALIISHDHTDHIRYAGVYQRKYGIPIFITPKTLEKAGTGDSLGKIKNINYFRSGEKLFFGSVTVQTIPTPHDGADGSAFVISSEGRRLGILTDLGHVFRDLPEVISSLDAVFLESNYDPAMLENGTYPYFLKERIKGPKGHLSNREAAELLQSGEKLQWVCLSHLSENNNDLRIALKTHAQIVGRRITFYTASRFTSSGILKV
ncbi:MAG: MBL fold metallo-hydrolase [Nitrospirota bacterium]